MDLHSIRQVREELNSIKEVLEMITPTHEEFEEILEEVDVPECKMDIVPCGELGPGDEINQYLDQMIETLVGQGWEEESAQEAVFSELAELVENQVIPDTPDVDADEQEKTEWLKMFDGCIWERLGKRMVATSE